MLAEEGSPPHRYLLWEELMIIDKKERFKGAQAWDIRDRVIYTERSHLGWWLEEWTKKSICVNCWVDIPHD